MDKRSLRAWAVVACLVVACGTVSSAAADGGSPPPESAYVSAPAWSPSGTQLAYIRSAPGNGEPLGLFVIGADGTGAHEVARGVGSFRWSPDGTRIAFLARSVAGDGLFVVDPDGTHLAKIEDEVGYGGPHSWDGYDGRIDWSPDGARLAYSRTVETGSTAETDVWTVDRDGQNRHQLAIGSYPAWSPDGRQIAYTDGFRISVMNTDGTDQHRVGTEQRTQGGVLYNAGGQWGPEWSPDGRQIAFREGLSCPAVSANGCGGIPEFQVMFVIDATGGSEIALPGGSAQWSPTADFVATHDLFGSTLHVTSRDATVAHDFDLANAAVWAPDGRVLAAEGYLAGRPSTIDVIAVGGSSRTAVAVGTSPAWSPDGGSIAFVQSCDGSPTGATKALALVHPDGTGLTRLTGCPATQVAGPPPSPPPPPPLRAVPIAHGVAASSFRRNRIYLAAVPSEVRRIAAFLPRRTRARLKRVDLDQYDLIAVFYRGRSRVKIESVGQRDGFTITLSLGTAAASTASSRPAYDVVAVPKEDVGSPPISFAVKETAAR